MTHSGPKTNATCYLDKDNDIFIREASIDSYRWYPRSSSKSAQEAFDHISTKGIFAQQQDDGRLLSLCSIAYGESTIANEDMIKSDIYRTLAQLGQT